jgi:hypothetical protein
VLERPTAVHQQPWSRRPISSCAAARCALRSMRAKLSSAAAALPDSIRKRASEVKEKASTVKNFLEDRLSDASESKVSWKEWSGRATGPDGYVTGDIMRRHASRAKSSLVDSLKARVLRVCQSVYADRIKPQLTEQDKFMPRSVRRAVHEMADAFWAEVSLELPGLVDRVLLAAETVRAEKHEVADAAPMLGSLLESPPPSPPPSPPVAAEGAARVCLTLELACSLDEIDEAALVSGLAMLCTVPSDAVSLELHEGSQHEGSQHEGSQHEGEGSQHAAASAAAAAGSQRAGGGAAGAAGAADAADAAGLDELSDAHSVKLSRVRLGAAIVMSSVEAAEAARGWLEMVPPEVISEALGHALDRPPLITLGGGHAAADPSPAPPSPHPSLPPPPPAAAGASEEAHIAGGAAPAYAPATAAPSTPATLAAPATSATPAPAVPSGGVHCTRYVRLHWPSTKHHDYLRPFGPGVHAQ